MKKNTLFLAAITVLCIAVPAVSFGTAQPKLHYIPSGSMEPTLQADTYVLVQPKPYQNISQVKRGDIILHTRFDAQSKKEVEVIKRVVGLPGDTVQTTGTRVLINGRVLPHVFLGQLRQSKYAPLVSIYQETLGRAKYKVQYGDSPSPAPAFIGKVPAKQLFCLSDNRDNTRDSRVIGPVPFASVTGKKP